MNANVTAGLKCDPLILQKKTLRIQSARRMVAELCEQKNMVSSIVPIISMMSLPRENFSI